MDIAELVGLKETTVRMKRCLGLTITPEALVLSEVHLESGKAKVDHLLKLPVPADKAQAKPAPMRTDFFNDVDPLISVLKQALGQVDWGTKDIVVTLSSHFGILRHFTMPRIDPRFHRQSIPLEARKYLPLSFDTATIDFKVRDFPDNDKMMAVIFGVTQNDNLAGVNEIVQRLGLKLAAVELTPLSVERAFERAVKTDPANLAARLHFDPNAAYTLLTQGGVPVLARENYWGADPTGSERRKLDLGGSIQFASNQLSGQKPQKVLVSGQMKDLFKNVVERESGLPTEDWKPDEALGMNSSEWGSFASVGAGLRFQGDPVKTVDFSGVGKASDEEIKSNRAIMLTAACAGVLIALGSLAYQVQATMIGAKLAKARRKTQSIAAFQGKSAKEIQAVVDGMRDQVRFLRSIMDKKDVTTQKLEYVAEDIPADVWLELLRYNNPIMANAKKMKQAKSIDLTGRAKAPTDAEELAMVNEFRNTLRSDARFTDWFPKIDLTFSGQGGVVVQKGSLEKNKGTSFKLTAGPETN